MSLQHLTESQLIAYFQERQQPCARTLGDGRMIAVDRDNHRVTMAFESTLEHCHSGSIVQGGFVAGMLDTAMSMAVMLQTDYQRSPATLELKVTYLSAATPGRNLATGWVVKAGGTIAFVEGELHNPDGELIARASSSARLVPMTVPELGE